MPSDFIAPLSIQTAPLAGPGDGLEIPDQATMLDYSNAQTRIDNLVQNWTSNVEWTKERRNLRNLRLNIKELRDRGTLKQNETIVPIRVIDTNISRELPPFIAYLKQSKRLGIFKNKSAATVKCERLEQEFTRVMQYPAWEDSFFKPLDGSSCHGWDQVEVCFDPSGNYDGNCYIDHIGHDELFFSLDAVELQACEFVLRYKYLSVSALKNLIDSDGWDESQVEIVLTNKVDGADKQNKPGNVADLLKRVAKVFMRVKGVVHVGWYHPDCSEWLKPPQKLFLGKRKQVTKQVMVDGPIDPTTNLPSKLQQPQTTWEYVDETRYPIRQLFWKQTEQKRITDHVGRAYLDEHKQSAATAIWSSFINGILRAQTIQVSPKQPVIGGAAPKQTSNVVEDGKLWSEPVEYFHFPYPDPLVLGAIRQLDTQNSQETNQVAWTVNNRQDSRKTAKEVESAEAQNSLINGVQVTLFSTFLRLVLMDCWEIVQSQALQGKIKFCQTLPPENSQQPPNPLAPPSLPQNDLELVGADYDVFAAGDTDVIEREQILTRMGEMWPLVQGTALAMTFLGDMMVRQFPDDGDRYKAILMTNQPKNTIIQGLAQTLSAAVMDPTTGKLKPEFQAHQQDLTQTLEGVKQALSVPG